MELKDWNLSKLGEDIWHNKYQQNNESFDDWIKRVSGGNEQVAQLIVDKKFLFGGRILSNRGIKDRGITCSNCYVVKPVEDNIESIFDTAGKLARTFSYGGGCGIDISNLREKGAEVHNAAKTTSGAVSFMDVFELAARVIGQNGRRGALMISMDCDHPDIHDFIDAKLDNKLEKCNISVRMGDKDMENREDVLQHIAHNNWDWAEPGILYWDTIRDYNMLNKFEDFEYAGVNPCAEEPLPAGGSCLLGALNLSAFVEAPFSKTPAFNLPEFKSAVRIAIRALNDVLDEGLPLHPLPEQRESVRDWRQIGLGIMGFGDMLLMLGYNYDTQDALRMIKIIGETLVQVGLDESCKLAKEYGAFPKCDGDKLLDSNFIKWHYENKTIKKDLADRIHTFGLRNSQLFTIAPTGSISTMLGVTGGVEPIFATHYTRKTESLHGEEKYYDVYTPIVQYMLDNKIIDKLQVKTIATAQNINPFDRVQVQGKWQEYIDASISSTVNLVEDTSEETIFQLYVAAWECGCKGLTVYRAGCKKEGVLTVDKPKEEKVPTPSENTIQIPIVDTDINNCTAHGTKIMTGCGSLWITAYFHNQTGQLCHIFLDKGSKGGCNSFMIGLSRLISLAGKKGATIDEIVDQLNSVPACPSYATRTATKGDTSPGKCCPSAIANALKQLNNNFVINHVFEQHPVEVEEEKIEIAKCPICGKDLAHTGGCITCFECGYSKCD